MIVEKYKRETEFCTFCPKMCRFVCPTGIAEARETVTPTGKQTMLYLVQRGAAALDADAADVFYHCTGCGLCTQYCDHGIEVYPVMEAARAEAVTAGVVLPAAQRVFENFRLYGNAYGNLLPLYAAKAGRRILREAQVFYVPDASAVAHNADHVDTILDVLDRLSADNVAMWPGPMLSSGYELLTLGFTEAFVKHAAAFAETAAAARTLVFASPHDAETVSRRYAEFGVKVGAELLTETRWLKRAVVAAGITGGKQRRVLYHDACTLGRGLGEYEEPREIISLVNGGAPLEFAWNREESKCCGWGGGYAFTNPESAKAVARARIDEALEQPFDEIVAASPSCALQLAQAGGRSTPVYDLMSWLSERL